MTRKLHRKAFRSELKPEKALEQLDEVLAIADFAKEFHGRLTRIQKIAEAQSHEPIAWRHYDIEAPAPEGGFNILGINESDLESPHYWSIRQ
jgi:hypothetical protein